jgi:hypothetical protein
VVTLGSNALGIAGFGLLTYLVGRIGGRSEDPVHFGSWRPAPRWAQILFGSIGGSISPYKLSLDLWGLSWAVGGFAIFATGNPPGTPLRQIIAAPMLTAVPIVVASWIVAFVGQAIRDW